MILIIDIFWQAFLTFFKHVAANEMPYGPLLGHAWCAGKEFGVPAGSTYPCPVVANPATDWAGIIQETRAAAREARGPPGVRGGEGGRTRVARLARVARCRMRATSWSPWRPP